MNLRDRVVYHQVHPAKLITDPLSGFLATILLWRRHVPSGLIVAILPPAAVSSLLIRRANLRPQRRSPLGHYAKAVPLWTLVPRLIGYAVLLGGAWQRNRLVCVVGVVLALLGLLPWRWLRRR